MTAALYSLAHTLQNRQHTTMNSILMQYSALLLLSLTCSLRSLTRCMYTLALLLLYLRNSQYYGSTSTPSVSS
jgi:hypothetical protein